MYAAVPKVPPAPTFSVEPSVPDSVNVFVTDNVLALVIVKTPVVVVIVKPLILVAVATPKTGVTKVGVELNTTFPVPVEVVVPVPPDVTGKVPEARAEVDVAYKAPFKVNALKLVPPLAVGRTPLTPVVSGSPVAFVNVTDVGVPKIGVTNVGDVLRTTDPVPVEVVTPVPP